MALPPVEASATTTTVFDQPFNNNTANGLGAVTKPPLPSGSGATSVVCLTATGNTSTGNLLSCTTTTDAQGSGKLRLTNNTTNKLGGVFGTAAVPFGVAGATQGLDITFNSYQYAPGADGADGLAFVLAAANPVGPGGPPAALGQGGGSLGYSNSRQGIGAGALPGIPSGYMGIGIDVYGSYSTTDKEGTACTDPPYISSGSTVHSQVVIRGPGNSFTGYCAVNSTATNTSSPPLALQAATRSASLIPVEAVFNPLAKTLITPSGITVPAGQYAVKVTTVGGTVKTLTGALPTVPAGLYPSSTWTTSGIPNYVTFGWTAASGGVSEFKELDNAKTVLLDPAPVLTVSQTSYNSTANPQVRGDPVTYDISPAVAAGTAEPGPITVVQTVAAGVTPLGAYGTGWVCGAPSGQTITCTNSNGPFTGGTSLNHIHVVGVVTGTTLTPALIRSGSTTAVSATGAVTGNASSATAGTLPTTPGGITLTPASGVLTGGNHLVVGGTNITAANAIEIGTAAEFQAGTPTVLLPCPSGSAPGCFTVSGGTLDISSMPAHALGAVQVKIVTEGVAGVATYTYVNTLALGFATPSAGTVGAVYSNTLTSTGGMAPITWSVSAGSLPPGLTLNSSTGTISGTPTTAGVFSFTIRADDAGAQTATQATSLTVAAGSLSINVPLASDLGTAPVGTSTLGGNLGLVTVADNRGGATAAWAVTVSATSFTTGAGPTTSTITTDKIAYSSGSGTINGTGTFIPATLANGSLPGIGASWTGGTAANSVAWNPTLTFTLIPVSGPYTGTITHSVA